MIIKFKKQFILLLIFSAICAQAYAAPSLDDKLKAQWQLYQKARDMLERQVQRTDILVLKDRVISRPGWEKMLGLSGELAFSRQDINDLKHSQTLRIEKAKALAKQDSVIDLDKVRSEKKAARFCEKVPKGGMLHIHPYGTLDRPMAVSLLKELNPVLDVSGVFQDILRSSGNVSLYPEEEAWLKKLPANTNFLSLSVTDQDRFTSLLFLPPGKHPFPRFNGVFEFIGFAVYDSRNKKSHFDEVMRKFAKKAVAEGVIYVEFTTETSPGLPEEIAALEQETGLVIRVNNSFSRRRGLEELEKDFSAFVSEPPSKYVVGIDFLDNENNYPALETGQLLYGEALKGNVSGKMKFHRTMHAGEIGDIRNPRDAMIMGAERLGHGVNLAKDPVALEYAAKVHEPVEINLSSNLRLTDVASIPEHPFLNYLRLGLPVSLSTDDEGIFGIDIDHECEIAVEQTDMTYAEFKQMTFNSIATAFASDADKQMLTVKLTDKFREFEKTELKEN